MPTRRSLSITTVLGQEVRADEVAEVLPERVLLASG